MDGGGADNGAVDVPPKEDPVVVAHNGESAAAAPEVAPAEAAAAPLVAIAREGEVHHDVISPELLQRPKEVTRLAKVSLTIEDCDDCPLEETITQATADYGGIAQRTELPVKKKVNKKDASIWGILKKNVGKNLSKISMPIAINEPLSALQRQCEELEHSHLLDRASDEADPAKQLLYLAVFAVSGYSNSYFRAGRKPFNPLLGETYDHVDTERKFRFVAEQVSHHPPMSASFTESPKWELAQESGGETKFRGTCLRIKPTGRIRVKLLPSGSIFEWCKVTTSVEDIMSGNKWCDHYGTMVITNDGNKNHAVVTFTESSMFKKDKRRDVSGQVFISGADVPSYTFSGKWNTQLVCPELGGEVLYKAPAVSADRVEEQYGFSPFACQLNALPPKESDARKKVAPTDSRLRPDQRMHEESVAGADAVKLELEQKQRDRRHAMEAEGKEWAPRYFAKTKIDSQVIAVSPRTPRKRKSKSKLEPAQLASHKPDPTSSWRFTGRYWAQKTRGEFDACVPLW
mmetsp:Transcript_26189/g.68782  ORF Transcript_26189/g.68782 Transcript_26189/m.68782 type:complete len:516 (+) Transcript_26189:180-1727(+)